MRVKTPKQNRHALRSSLVDRSAPATFLVVAAILTISAPTTLSAADDDSGNSIAGLCESSGGTFAELGDGTERCCWANWGCLNCDSSNGADGLTECETAPCCISNGGRNVIQGTHGPAIADPEGDPGRPVFDQVEAEESVVALDDSDEYTPIGIGEVQYTPIGDMVELFLAIGPDFRREDLESRINEGISNGVCGAGSGGSLILGMMGFVELTGTNRGGRNRRHVNRRRRKHPGGLLRRYCRGA